MNLNELSISEVFSILTLVFVAGGLFWQSKNLNKRFDDLIKRYEIQYGRLSNHETRISVAEKELSMLTGEIKDMSQKIDEIYKNSLSGK